MPAVQQWMQSVLQHPAGVVDGSAEQALTIPDVIMPSTRQSAVDRLAIYGRAYWARLLDCLAAQFPALKAAAGDDAFAGFATGYLQVHPSQSKSLNDLGRNFCAYLTATRPDRAHDAPDYADFLIDLATLEWCYNEVFDAVGPETTGSLNREEVAALGPDAFSKSRLQLHETVRLLTLKFPCHEFATAVRQSREPTIPAPEATHLVVFRREFIVRRLSVPLWQYELLKSLQAGESVETAIAAAIARNEYPSDLEHQLRQCFSTWTDAPIFQSVLTDS